MVPEGKKATAAPHEITIDEVKRVLEVGKLLLSVLTQTEVEMLRRHFQQQFSKRPTGHASPDTVDDKD